MPTRTQLREVSRAELHQAQLLRVQALTLGDEVPTLAGAGAAGAATVKAEVAYVRDPNQESAPPARAAPRRPRRPHIRCGRGVSTALQTGQEEEVRFWKAEALRLAGERDGLHTDLTTLLGNLAARPRPPAPAPGGEDAARLAWTAAAPRGEPPHAAAGAGAGAAARVPLVAQKVLSRAGLQAAAAQQPLAHATHHVLSAQLDLVRAQIAQARARASFAAGRDARARAGGGFGYTTLEETMAEIRASAARPAVRSYAQALEAVQTRDLFGW